MRIGKREEPAVTVFDDHEVIVPPNTLRKAWADAASDNGDPVARAEQALAALSSHFADWMDGECARLDAARRDARSKGWHKDTRETLFRAAHDIKGEAQTFGFPLAAAAADSLCRLIEGIPPAGTIPIVLIEQHVDAIKAIVREHARPDAETMANELTERLCAATDDCLSRSNGESAAGGADAMGRADIASPPTAPRAAGK